MLSIRLGFLRPLTTWAFLFGTGSAVFAVGWSDDFNDGNVTDGNPVTWNQNMLGAFPGTYDASSGDYALSAPGDANGNQIADDDQLVSWVNGVRFADTYIRTQGVVLPGTLPEELGGNLVILGRLDAASVSGYLLYIDSGGQLGLQISLGGEITDLIPPVPLVGLEATSDVVIELNIVGDQLSGFAWRPGEAKPASPHITATDATFVSGDAGIAYDEDDDNTRGVFRFAAAQDTPFSDALPGDYNNNGEVDAADYTVWRDTFGSTSDLSANGDNNGASVGVIDAADFHFWKANFGAGGSVTAGATSTVPESTSLVWTLIAIVVCCAEFRRGR